MILSSQTAAQDTMLRSCAHPSVEPKDVQRNASHKTITDMQELLPEFDVWRCDVIAFAIPPENLVIGPNSAESRFLFWLTSDGHVFPEAGELTRNRLQIRIAAVSNPHGDLFFSYPLDRVNTTSTTRVEVLLPTLLSFLCDVRTLDAVRLSIDLGQRQPQG
jgi:hypothetical protein